MGSGVCGALIEPHAGDEAIYRGRDLHAELVSSAIPGIGHSGNLGAEDCVRAGQREIARCRGADIGAVVDGADLDAGGRQALLDVSMSPVLLSLGGVPRGSAVGGYFDTGNDATGVAALPVTVTLAPCGIVAPWAGEEMVTVGPVRSLLAVAGASAGSRVPGWAPMSARRFICACCIRGSAGAPGPSCSWSRPQVHWTVPAENTKAPLAARYSVVL